MTPDPITRLNAALEGRYKIERELGEGGMATVYLAEDLRHERKVALKVLKPELAAVVGAERFLAEIKTTANLQHPHILPLFDSGQAEGFLYYVMPYVEGESLRRRIDRDHQLPVEEAVGIATNVAEALDYAHRQGVIHRDIKPANVLMLSGKPVISDFGIALAVGAAGGGRLTETGLSLGTPHYMSPEQATGDQNVGPQTDIYALGCVLYEMLLGEPPYTGPNAQAVLGQIITAEAVSARKKRGSIPPNVDAATRKALEKLPADRFASAQEFAGALGDPGFRHGEEAAADSMARGGLWNPLSVAATILALVFAIGFGWSLLRPEPQQPVARFSFAPEEGQLPIGPIAFTADGTALVYLGPGQSGQGSQLWIRQWADLQATPINGTENASGFALSPDGSAVAFLASSAFGVGGPLRVVPLEGGPARTLVEGVFEVTEWTPDGTVYYSILGGTAIAKVPTEGGDGEAITERLEGEVFHGGFKSLPGGRMGVFQVWRDGTGVNSEIWAIGLDSGERRFLTAGHGPEYAPTGHLLFVTAQGTLVAASIDPGTADLTGPPVPVAEGLAVTPPLGHSFFAVSEHGTLVYMSGGQIGQADPVWLDRRGTEQPLGLTLTGRIEDPAISPDGRRIAFSYSPTGPRQDDIWVYDLDQGTFSRLTFGAGSFRNLDPFWTPDGSEVGFSSDRAGSLDLYSQPADMSTEARLLVSVPDDGLYEGSWTPDGRRLLYRLGSTPRRDLWHAAPDPDSIPVVILDTPAIELQPSLSPDGRWLVYVSDESGRREVYIRPFPGPGGRSQVSIDGGSDPAWAHSGREIFYLDSSRYLTVAAVRTEPDFAVESREQLFSFESYASGNQNLWWDVAPDDQRILALKVGATAERLILVQNFFEELRQVVPDN